MDWVDVRARTVELAIAAGLEELGIASADEAEIEVLEQPEKGFLGLGGRDAVVRIKPKPKPKRKRRRRSRGGSEDRGKDGRGTEQRRQPQGRAKESEASQGRQAGKGGGKKRRAEAERKQRGGEERKEAAVSERDTPTVDINEQAEVVKEFLDGLLDAFGLEGEVSVQVDDGFILANIVGEQTEALIGPKAAILQAIHELSKTVVQRRTQSGARLRLDIGGYAERRREALTIYAGRLAAQVVEEGEEVMLEPMNPADRKVVHDAVAEIDGVRSFSEGEEPRRSVVIAPE